MAQPAIETVIFDLGNVLVNLDDREVWRRIAAVAGCSAREVRARFVGGMQHMIAYETGRLSSAAYYETLLQLLQLDQARYPFAAFCENWCAVLVPCPVMQRLFHECCRLRTTCLLSNTNELHWRFVAERCDLLPHAHHVLTSYECGLYKPQPAIFALALERFGVADPATAVFIDDREENVAAARAVGISAAFQHVNAAATRARLVELGVLNG